MSTTGWEFWVDVGGTFTDCLALAPDGVLRRLKILSTGATKGEGTRVTDLRFQDPARSHDLPHFWNGWRVAIYGEAGEPIDGGVVETFDASCGQISLRDLENALPATFHYELRSEFEAPVVAVRHLLGLGAGEPIPPISLRLGTTRGTNALITRTGARTALVTTHGFGDLLEIGYQARPALFELTIRKPPPLPQTSIEIKERISHEGEILVPIDEREVRRQIESLRNSGIESLAICLLHGDRHPVHEQVVGRIAHEVGFREISCSHRVARHPRIVARGETTAVDAYLNPVLRAYIERLQSSLPGSRIRLLTSAGGVVDAESFSGKDSVLSGPAGGVVGFAGIARAAGFAHAIGFDMGGTSTDVARYDGAFELEFETRKAGVRLLTPTLAIETIAAGGGSICKYDGTRLVVGPESAGADPGPACYGRGGPLTVTDVNLFLGRLIPDRFPFRLDRKATRERLVEVALALPSEPCAGETSDATLDRVAHGFLVVANSNMASAIRTVTVSKGLDPADYLLVSFGGAGPQHACAIAGELGIRRILNHPQSGVLSALGIGMADVVRYRSFGVEAPLGERSLRKIARLLDSAEREATAEIIAEGIPPERILAKRSLDLRYAGVDSVLSVEWPMDCNFARDFDIRHRQRFGFVHEDRDVEIAAARVEVTGIAATRLPRSESRSRYEPRARRTEPVYFDTRWVDTPLFDRESLEPGHVVRGPAVITEAISTTLIDPGWEMEVLSEGDLLITACKSEADLPAGMARRPVGESRGVDPALLEIFNNHVAGIATQMGATLRNTASSVNVKERLDFSCAVFTSDGRLIANAPHVPVHLGAMEETVRQVIRLIPHLGPGDVVATNDPFTGGSHLPDVTVVTPVHDRAAKRLFFVANRAHHAEIGGKTPGSMPPDSTNLGEEGVLLKNIKIVEAGNSRLAAVGKLLLGARDPTRDIRANLGDLAAQIASNEQGGRDLLAMVERFSWPVVRDYSEYVIDAADAKTRRALSKFAPGRYSFADFIENLDGESHAIKVAIDIFPPGSSLAAVIDFEGTAPVDRGNLNANPAIVSAAIIYVLRTLIDEPIPLNHGVLRSVEIRLPECLLNPKAGATPGSSPAVAGGNVETSQRVVDVLLGALGVAGASQGTMNNVLFGDSTFGYYETICGGSGATAEGPGASAVQVHMTNTRITDPEILERRHPIRVHEFSIRRGSGGVGRFRGGDGVVRRLEFLRPLTLSLLTQRRGPHPPGGAAGGGAGALGRNALIRASGAVMHLAGIARVDVETGDIIVIETPGGGGFGKAEA